MRRLLAGVGLACALAVSVGAQQPIPAVLVPASSVNGAGVSTQAIVSPAGTGTQTGKSGLTVFTSVATTGSTGGGAEADVASYPMPANTLSADGQSLTILICAIHAANTNSTTLRLYVDGSVVASATEATSTAVPCVTLEVTRTSSTTLTYSGIVSGGSNGITRAAGTQSAKNFAGAIILKYSVQAATTTNDLIGDHMQVRWWPLAT